MPPPAARDAGRITSAAPSAGHGGAAFVALGYVRRGWETPGTLLDAVLPPEPVAEFPGSLARILMLTLGNTPALPGRSVCAAFFVR